jgi:hypothetical protein
MQKAVEIIRQPRQFLLSLTEHLTLEQLNQVPAGFNNNIIWNLGHMVAAQQNICYRRAGLTTMHISEAYFEFYKSDTKPERPVTQAEVDEVKRLMVTTIDQLETDYTNGIFNNYIPWTTRYGVAINSIDDALSFLPFHEGLHVGYIIALKRVIAV